MLDGLGSLTEKSDTIYKVNWAFILIFVFLECAPILVKIMTKSGPFDYALAAIEDSEKYAEEVNKQLFVEISQNFKTVKIEQHKHWVIHEKRAFTDTLIASEVSSKEKRDALVNIAASTVLDKTFSNIINSVQSDFAKVSIIGNTNLPEHIGYGARAVEFIKVNAPALGVGAFGLYILQMLDIGTKFITLVEKVWAIIRPFFAILFA